MDTCSRYPLNLILVFSEPCHLSGMFWGGSYYFHHAHLVCLTKDHLQRGCRLRKIAIPSSQALSLLSRDLREAHLQVLLGSSGYRTSTTNGANAAHDPFLSSLILNYPASEVEDISKSMLTSAEDTSSEIVAPSPIWKSRYLFTSLSVSLFFLLVCWISLLLLLLKPLLCLFIKKGFG